MMTEPATGLMTSRPTLPHPPSILLGLMEEYNGLGILYSFYAKLLFQLAEPFASVPKTQRMIRGEIA